jgi:hypothetical protein
MSDADPTLEYLNTTPVGRIVQGCLWFFVAGCCLLFTLPFWQSRGDPYPWGFSAVAWTIAALLILAGIADLRHQSGAVFDRRKGVLILWSTSFGRRRERRIPLGVFTEVGVGTWVQTQSRSRVDCRYYDVELRGPKHRERMGLFTPVNRPENIRVIAEYLKLPIKVEDREPGREPKSAL